MPILISDYLQSRRYNSTLLRKVGELLEPHVDKFNEENERKINVEWCMSAKYQRIQIKIEMEDENDVSYEAECFATDSEFAEVLESWIGACTGDYETYKSYLVIECNL